MGGCCSSGRARSERVPVYLYCPPVLEHERFSSTHNTVSGLTSGILVDTNLDLSSPDTYRAPPAPLPYDMGIVRPQALPVNSEVDMGKNAPVTSMDTHPPERTFSDDRVEDSVQCKGLKHSNDSGNFEATKIDDCKSTKWNGPVDFEEEDCPICLEEYNMENPKMITKCGHHFHLCCMLEWMERSDVCPMCDQELKDTLKLEFDMKDIGSTGRILGMKIKRERNFGFIVSWKSTLQPTISLSTTEAEYVAMIEAAKEEIWLKCLLGDLGWHIDKI